MAKHPRVYPPEFRHKILKLVRLGRSVNSVAREFEMDADSGRRDDILNSSERAELTRKSRGLVRSGGRHDSQEIFEFVKAYQTSYTIAMLCRVLKVSESGFYAWSKRAPSAIYRLRGADLVVNGVQLGSAAAHSNA